ncbi:SprT-like family-domain-containing protein, partial [Blastocladiella britannica]
PPRPEMSARQYARQRSALTAAAYTDFNQRAFGSKLPVDLVIAWNKRLNTTAGRTWPTRYPPGHASIPTLNRPVSAADGYVYDARIELSAKVLDTPAKLERTLLHEMCHVAAWLLDHTSRPPHGDVFWKYARAATDAVPHLAVSTRHTYAIAYKFTYVCSQCGHKYGRHSKSIDTATRRCGACQDGQLV